LAQEMAAAMQAPDLRARMTTLGVDPIGSDADTFARFLEQEHQRWGEVIRRSGAKVD
jgi:tripartite-type tricarboxylate transporter receptor subunit TctC